MAGIQQMFHMKVHMFGYRPSQAVAIYGQDRSTGQKHANLEHVHVDTEPSLHVDQEPSVHVDLEHSVHIVLEPSVHVDQEPSMYIDLEQSMLVDPVNSMNMDPEHSVKLDPEQSVHVDPEHSMNVVPEPSLHVDAEQSVNVDAEHSVHVDLELSVHVDPEHSVHVDPEHSVHVDLEHSVHVVPEHSVHLDPEQSVNVDPEPSLHVDLEHSVHVDPEPSVHVDPKPSVHVDPEPSVQIDLEQSVNVDPEPSVHIDPKQSVNGDPEHSLHVDPEHSVHEYPGGIQDLPSLEVTHGNSVDVGGASTPSNERRAPGLGAEPLGAAGGAVPAFYLVKWITWKGQKTPIVTQCENGPCPLLAVMNTLFLRWKARLPAQTEVVTAEELMAHLGECVLSVMPREKTDGMELNFQQNVSDAMAVLPKLSTGMDVNVRFTGVTHFEYTPECIVFDLLDIPLYHGWLVDPQSSDLAAAVGKLSYNQLVEKIIESKQCEDSRGVSEGLAAELFLQSSAAQLSYHGLCELNAAAQEEQLAVFFRNNHFSTMIKHQGHLYLLVSDQGFLGEQGVVWESLHNVEGDGNFCDSDFRLSHPPEQTDLPAHNTHLQQRQIDQDYLVAVSLLQSETPPTLSDLEFARALQQEEYTPPQVRGQSSRRREKDSDCVVL